ncbi:MAG: hypothetical protein JNK12_14500 [Acidimicrobiales bacterium]|nr:hypothetical protein [Acidimicrobiales bacterium]
MDDLIDRLSEVRPRPSRGVDLTQVRRRVHQRRRRRRVAIGALGAVVVLAGVVGAGRLVADSGEVQLEVVGPVTSAVPIDPVPVDPAAVGPERQVATGPMPDGGTWAFVAYETAYGLCGKIETPAGEMGDCFSVPPYDETLNVLYSDGRANGGLLFARAVVTPEVATVRINLAGRSVDEPAHNAGTSLELEPTDVGLPLDFVFTPLADDAVVTSVEALDVGGRVLATADGYTGPGE